MKEKKKQLACGAFAECDFRYKASLAKLHKLHHSVEEEVEISFTQLKRGETC